MEPFFVPYHDKIWASNDKVNIPVWAASGVFSTTPTERGLTYVNIDMVGHMVSQYAPS